MILRWSIFATAMLASGVAFAQNPTTAAPASSSAQSSQQQQTPPAPITAADKPNLSYAIGYQIGNDFLERKMDIDINTVIRAMQDELTFLGANFLAGQSFNLAQNMCVHVFCEALFHPSITNMA